MAILSMVAQCVDGEMKIGVEVGTWLKVARLRDWKMCFGRSQPRGFRARSSDRQAFERNSDSNGISD